MVPDWDTTRLFVSDRLEHDQPAVFAGLHRALRDVAIEIIPGTADIWCRDYMPIQLNASCFCQFDYRPDYLRNLKQRITPPQRCRLPFMKCRQAELVLDGGNVVAARTRVIMTEKVYKENPSLERWQLRDRLEKLFEAECLLIPKEPYDVVGHADGVARFVSENRVLIGDYARVDPGYGMRLQGYLEKRGLEVATLPMFLDKQARRVDGIPSAVGNYLNYLRLGNVVVLPAYERPEDEVARDRIAQELPKAQVFQLPCTSLARRGGVLNCITWTIR